MNDTELEKLKTAADTTHIEVSYDYDGVHEALVLDDARKAKAAYARKSAASIYFTKDK